MPPPIVETQALTKTFGDLVAVADLDLSIAAGEVYGLLGPNGAGKTTTVAMLATLLAPTRGSARIAGFDLGREHVAIRGVLGYVPQDLSNDRSLSAWENALYWGRLQRLRGANLRERCTAELQRVGLWEHRDRKVRGFSGGMRKKLDLACGLLHRPQVLILDEPSLGLDVESRRALWDRIEGLRADGACVLLCTNAMDEADRLCARIGIVDRGRLVREGTPAELKAQVGGEVVVLEPAPDALPRIAVLAARLERGVPGVSGVTRTESAIHVAVSHGPEAIPSLVALAGEEGVALARVTFKGPSLEDAFVALTGREYPTR